ncbi:hypothetical protein [Flavobacterium sp. 3HN19-14]|uniref:hypothetical protein n=1 Tax=Flavobacterium sp. 3HN19-14 TaxID=3448133 RepID=UPI003EE00A5D
MKNLIIALSLFFALGANAQAKKAKATAAPAKAIPATVAPKLTGEAAAKKNIQDLAAFVTLTPEKQASLTELFVTKQRMMTEAGASAERKEVVSEIIGRKLEATLDGETFAKVKANTTLYQSLIRQ